MKKSLSLLLATLLLTLSLSGCGMQIYELKADQQAVALYNHAQEKMQYAEEYDYRYALNASISYDDVPYSYIVEGRQSYDSDVSDPKHVITSKITYRFDKTNNVSESISGYMDGKMFSSYRAGDMENHLFMTLDFFDYVSHRQQLAKDFQQETLDMNYGEEKSVVQKANGTWHLSFSKFYAQDIEIFLNQWGLSQTISGMADTYTAVDLQVDAELSEDLFPKRITTKLIFRANDGSTANLPSVTLVEEYDDDDACPEIEFSKYKQVDDLRVLDYVEFYLRRWDQNNNVSFRFDYNTKVTESNKVTTEKGSLTGKSSMTDGAYKFSATQKSSYENWYYTYENGLLKSTDRSTNDTQSNQMTDAIAKENFNNLASPPVFLDVTSVTAIQKDATEEGKYLLTLSLADDFMFYSLFPTAQVKSSIITATIRVVDGQWDGKISYYFQTTGKDQGVSYGTQTEMTCTYTFTEPEETKSE